MSAEEKAPWNIIGKEANKKQAAVVSKRRNAPRNSRGNQEARLWYHYIILHLSAPLLYDSSSDLKYTFVALNVGSTCKISTNSVYPRTGTPYVQNIKPFVSPPIYMHKSGS